MDLEAMKKPSPSRGSREDVEKNNSDSHMLPKYRELSRGRPRRRRDNLNGQTPDELAEATSILSLHSREAGDEADHASNSALPPSSGNLEPHTTDENAPVAGLQQTELLPVPLEDVPVSSSGPQSPVESRAEPFPAYYEVDAPVIDTAREEAYNYALGQVYLYSHQHEEECLQSRQGEAEAEADADAEAEAEVECPGHPPEPPSICPGQSDASTDLLAEANRCAHSNTVSDGQASGVNPTLADGHHAPPAATPGECPVAPPNGPGAQSTSLGSAEEPEQTPESELDVSLDKPLDGSLGQVDSALGNDMSPEPGREDQVDSAQEASALEDTLYPEPVSQDQVDGNLEGEVYPGLIFQGQGQSALEGDTNTDIMSYIPTVGTSDECLHLLGEMRRLLRSPRVPSRLSGLYHQMGTHVLNIAHISLRRFMLAPHIGYNRFLRPVDMHLMWPRLVELRELFRQFCDMLGEELENVDNVLQTTAYRSTESNVEPLERFVNVADTIIENLYMVQPLERQLFETFHNFSMAWLYNDFYAIRMAQMLSETVPSADRITVTDMILEINRFLTLAGDRYLALNRAGSRVFTEVVTPMAVQVQYGTNWWDHIYNQRSRALAGRHAHDDREIFLREQELQAQNAHLAGLV